MKILSIILSTFCISFIVKSQTFDGGSFHSLFICPDGQVNSTGYNNYGQLGNSTNIASLSLVTVSELSNIIAVSAGHSHSLFLRNDGTVWVCGYNGQGQLGDGTNIDRNTPVQLNGLSNVIAISSGGYHSLFLKDDGTVWACGYNSSGQLGDGTFINRNAPVQINGLSNIQAIDAGHELSLFLKSNGTVWACGENFYGQFGIGTQVGSNVPIQSSSLSNIIAFAAGENHSLFLKSDGTVWACGKNSDGELGDGTFDFGANVPGQVTGLSNIISVAAGGGHSLFLKSDGTVWACGRNMEGQLGDGTTVKKSSPIQVGPLGVTAIASGYWYSMFFNDSYWATGQNTNGQFGNGTNTGSLLPIQVISQLNCKRLGISDITPSDFEIDVFPNPFEDEIHINYLVQNEVTMDMYITDMQGRNLTESDLKTIFPGQYQSVISLKEFAPGNYILWGHINGELYLKNIVKK